jgi:inward rectifier potassium channel
VNLSFGALYFLVGGIAGADGTYFDALSFSVQTLATIGYGAMYPMSAAAEGVMILESIVSLILTALVTGLVFAKFSRPTAREVPAGTRVPPTRAARAAMVMPGPGGDASRSDNGSCSRGDG